MFYGNIDMYSYKYNTFSQVCVNKKMMSYLKFYQDTLIKDIFKKQTPKINTFMKLCPPIDPNTNTYLILFPLTNIFCFLAGYYSHYFLKK